MSRQTIVIPAWHINEFSGTGIVLRNLLFYFKQQTTISFLVIYPTVFSFHFPHLMKEKLPHFKVIFFEKATLTHSKWLEKIEDHLLSLKANFLVFYPNTTLPLTLKIPFITLIHDLIPLKVPEYYLNPFKLYQEKRKLLLSKKAKAIITVSYFSKQDIVKYLKIPSKKVTVIHNGIDFSLKNELKLLTYSQNNFKATNSLFNFNYILYVGDFTKRKNVITLVKAYLQLPHTLQKQYHLCLTGENKPFENKVNKLFKKHNLEDYIHFLGKISTKTLIKMYQKATLFVFPSKIEGFGLPIIEAQYFQLPVICGNHSSLKEISQNSCCYSNIHSSKDLSKTINHLLSNPKTLQDFAKKSLKNSQNFSFQKASHLYLKLFKKL